MTVGFGMGFLSRSLIWDRDFLFWARKIPTIPKSQGSGIDYRGFFWIFGKSPGFGIFLVSGFVSPGIGIFLNFGIFLDFEIFILGIFAKSPGFGIFSRFLSSRYPGDFLYSGSGFFVGWDIKTKSHLCLRGLKSVSSNLIERYNFYFILLLFCFSPRLPRSFHEKVVFVILVCHLWESIEMVIRNPWSPGGLSRRGLSCYLQYTWEAAVGKIT